MGPVALALDLSLAMPMRDHFDDLMFAARSLHDQIADRSGITPTLVGFAREVRELHRSELADLSWDFVYESHMAGAIEMARELVGPDSDIIVVSEDEPTVCIGTSGPEHCFPPQDATYEPVIVEGWRCLRSRVRVHFLSFERWDPSVSDAVARLTMGHATFLESATVDDDLVRDFLERVESSAPTVTVGDVRPRNRATLRRRTEASPPEVPE